MVLLTFSCEWHGFECFISLVLGLKTLPVKLVSATIGNPELAYCACQSSRCTWLPGEFCDCHRRGALPHMVDNTWPTSPRPLVIRPQLSTGAPSMLHALSWFAAHAVSACSPPASAPPTGAGAVAPSGSATIG